MYLDYTADKKKDKQMLLLSSQQIHSSNLWSINMPAFCDAYLPEPMIVTANKVI